MTDAGGGSEAANASFRGDGTSSRGPVRGAGGSHAAATVTNESTARARMPAAYTNRRTGPPTHEGGFELRRPINCHVAGAVEPLRRTDPVLRPDRHDRVLPPMSNQ